MKECIILAGGLGTRLQSVVKDIPKCMAEVAEKPFLHYMMRYLERQNFEHVILALGYKSEVVIEWLEQNPFSFKISYVIENKPLGTGGAIRFAYSKANTNTVFVVNGDTFFDVDTNLLQNFHNNAHADISLALKPMTGFDRYGTVSLASDNKIIGFEEKTFKTKGLINGGVYLINRNAIDGYEDLQAFSFEKDILEKRIAKLKIYGLVQDRYFIDIGIPKDYDKANIDFSSFNV